MCENNHNESNLAKLAIPMVGWGYPKDIGNNAINRICYDILNLSPALNNCRYSQKCFVIFTGATAILTNILATVDGGTIRSKLNNTRTILLWS